MQKTKKSLKEQLQDLLDNFASAQAELKQLRIEKSKASQAETMAEAKVQRIIAESTRERTYLVQAALKSMNDLRSHVMHTTSGVRMQYPLDDDGDDGSGVESFISWDTPTRWGHNPTKKSEALLVSLKTPAVPAADAIL